MVVTAQVIRQGAEIQNYGYAISRDRSSLELTARKSECLEHSLGAGGQ